VTEGFCQRPSGVFFPPLHLGPGAPQRLLLFRQRRLTLFLALAWDELAPLSELALPHLMLELQLALRAPLLLLEQALLGLLRALPPPSPEAPQLRVLDFDAVRNSLQVKGFLRPGPMHPLLVQTAVLQALAGQEPLALLQGAALLSRKLQRELDWPRTGPGCAFLGPGLLAAFVDLPSARALGEAVTQLLGQEGRELGLRVSSAGRGGQWLFATHSGLPSSALMARLGPTAPRHRFFGDECRAAGVFRVVLAGGLATFNELWAALADLR